MKRHRESPMGQWRRRLEWCVYRTRDSEDRGSSRSWEKVMERILLQCTVPPAARLWPRSLQNREGVGTCRFKPPGCAVLLGQPWELNAPALWPRASYLLSIPLFPHPQTGHENQLYLMELLCESSELCELNNRLKHHLRTVGAPVCKPFWPFLCAPSTGLEIMSHLVFTLFWEAVWYSRTRAQKNKNPKFKFRVWFWTSGSSSTKQSK